MLSNLEGHHADGQREESQIHVHVFWDVLPLTIPSMFTITYLTYSEYESKLKILYTLIQFSWYNMTK